MTDQHAQALQKTRTHKSQNSLKISLIIKNMNENNEAPFLSKVKLKKAVNKWNFYSFGEIVHSYTITT